MLTRLRPETEDSINRIPRRIAPVVTEPPARAASGGNDPGSRRRPRALDAGQSIRKRKRRPGNATIREIRRLQATTDFLIPKLPFARVVKDICGTILPGINK